ncbi:hypothetical protein LaPh949_gp029 [Lactococcus phage 949]|uniref:Uncharacterized protein n=1 Tax=Lactococcus phage 949 TaxID=881953 RepID=E0YIR6_9CAUD|nr:hypothetical protein LaPh949_gp029 [Lactococcus phage 949]ADM73587.1 hypothetical protein [Lactococcus phage 949]
MGLGWLGVGLVVCGLLTVNNRRPNKQGKAFQNISFF